MSYQIIQHDEPLKIENIIAVLFGEPGTGKSSLAQTAESPLTMDFDNGLQRVVGRKAAVKFNTWPDALEFIESDFIPKNEIKTLIADTGGTMLDDYVAHHILKMDVKGVDNGAGGLGLRGYGVMKDVFAKFLVACKKHKVDIIFVCHSKKEDDGEVKRFFPQLTGGSSDILMSKCDLVGYMEMMGESITLDFNPTARHTGKNCAQFQKMTLPHFTDGAYSNFFAKLIENTKNHMNKQNEAQIQALKIVESYKEQIDNVDNIEALEKFKEGIAELSPIYRAQVYQFFDKKYAELWSLENIEPEQMKTPESFVQLTEKIKALPRSIQSELQETVLKLLESAGIVWSKTENKFLSKDEVKGESKQPKKEEQPPAPDKKQPSVKSEKTDKAEPKKSKKSDPKPPAPDENNQTEEWFIEHIGKQVYAKSNKYTGPMTINDETHAFHLFHVSQKTQGYIFSELEEAEVSQAESVEKK